MTFERISPEQIIRERLAAKPERVVIEIDVLDYTPEQAALIIDWWHRTLRKIGEPAILQRKPA